MRVVLAFIVAIAVPFGLQMSGRISRRTADLIWITGMMIGAWLIITWPPVVGLMNRYRLGFIASNSIAAAIIFGLLVMLYLGVVENRRSHAKIPVQAAVAQAADIRVLLSVEGGQLIDLEHHEVLVGREQPDLRFHVRNDMSDESLRDVRLAVEIVNAPWIQQHRRVEETFDVIHPEEVAPGRLHQYRISQSGSYQFRCRVNYRYGPKEFTFVLRR